MATAYDHAISKQIRWAEAKGIQLVGSKLTRGRPTYTVDVNENLFEPLEPDIKKAFSRGDGNELNENSIYPGKMQAVHSSSALGVNVFQFWQKIGQVNEIAAACGFAEYGSKASQNIVFEDKYRIFGKGIAPNIDVVFHNSSSYQYKRYAVECKFSEAYRVHRGYGLKPEYFIDNSKWVDTPNLYKLGQSICPDDNTFTILHPAQLIKHILGLKSKFGKDGFKLLYLWYDVPGIEGVKHREETFKFREFTLLDGLNFTSMSYQELIQILADKFRQEHSDYINYLTVRYL